MVALPHDDKANNLVENLELRTPQRFGKLNTGANFTLFRLQLSNRYQETLPVYSVRIEFLLPRIDGRDGVDEHQCGEDKTIARNKRG